ncbi:MAG: putative glycoside hydrolase [Cellulosilyticaceae bacterium]
MKRWMVKPYNSYYHYKQRKMVLKRVSVILIVFSFIIAVFSLTNSFSIGEIKDFIVRAIATNNRFGKETFYLEQDKVMYGLFPESVKVKGVYVPANKISKLDELIDLANTTEINTFVIDVKNDYGFLTFHTDNQYIQSMGSVSKTPNIADIENVMDKVYAANVYPIARIVTFKDNIVGKTHPDRMMKDKNGEVYKTKDGDMWLNPYDKRNWEYILEICKEAIGLGFKEIQFDYVRFHETMNDERVQLPKDVSKTEIITEFMAYMYENLKPYGVFVSADVFGAIITSQLDAQIVGQDYKDLVKHLDYISPMVYPSHYASGSFGTQYPDLQPYDIILGSMQASAKLIKEIPRNERKAVVRPWLQDFTATWVKPHQVYGAQQIREQIQATYDAVLDQWILWNGAANYTKEGLEKQEGSE